MNKISSLGEESPLGNSTNIETIMFMSCYNKVAKTSPAIVTLAGSFVASFACANEP
jgi:hypothetical protein